MKDFPEVVTTTSLSFILINDGFGQVADILSHIYHILPQKHKQKGLKSMYNK